MTVVRNTFWVVALKSSWAGEMSSDVASGMGGASGHVFFVYCMLFCCMRRWPKLVAMDLGRYLEMSSVVRPGQLSKWPREMARRKVDGTGLKA